LLLPARPLTPRPRQPGKTLLTGWLLLLLCEGEQHGWALRTQLAERGIVADGARVYRHLRELESEGALASCWAAPVGGPKRRRYGLAARGPARLDELAAAISSTWRLHADFVEAQQRASLPQTPVTQQAAPATAVGRELLSAWLLLLLDDRASYGYDLRHALRSHHVGPDAGALYRALRQLDDEGLLRSSWVNSTTGPRQRHYRVTAKGRRTLVELTGVITAIRDRHRAFLQEYERVSGNSVDVPSADGRPRGGGRHKPFRPLPTDS
jgi:PadR family transcriptional regulator PadR